MLVVAENFALDAVLAPASFEPYTFKRPPLFLNFETPSDDDSDDDAVIATNAQQINSDTIVASVEDFIQEDLVKVVFVVFNKASSSSRTSSASAAW